MTQNVLPFKYEEEKKDTGISAFGGSLLFLELMEKIGFSKIVRSEITVKKGRRGWSDVEILLSLILLNICGGECVDDIGNLEKDSGLNRILKHLSLKGKFGRRRKKQEQEWKSKRSFPSQSPIFRYLSSFHDKSEEAVRKSLQEKARAAESQSSPNGKGVKEHIEKAFIPSQNAHLCGLGAVNGYLINFLQKNHECRTATLDMDATIIASKKKNALFTYKGIQGYQPLNTYWWEQGLILYTEFRDGNVPAGHQQKRVFAESLKHLPENIDKVYLRSDTAGYQHDLLKYCDMAYNERFGRIEFAVGCDITPSFKKEVYHVTDEKWLPIRKPVNGVLVETGQEWAEVDFVPNAISKSKKGRNYRYFAIREQLKQKKGPCEEEQKSFPFATMQFKAGNYKLFGLVSNMDWEGEKLIHWSRKRCGDSEHVHSEMKEAFAGGQLPSGNFGSNAAWWWIMILALNLSAIMRIIVLGGLWKKKRMKSVRISVIYIACRVLRKGRQFEVRVSKGHPSTELLLNARNRIESLRCCGLPSE